MIHYDVQFTKEAVKDIKKLTPKLRTKLKDILAGIAVAPHEGKKLLGDLSGFYSLRLTYQDRIIYSIDELDKVIYIHRTRTRYGE